MRDRSLLRWRSPLALCALLVTFVTAFATAFAVTPASANAAPDATTSAHAKAKKKVATKFALGTSGFGTRVVGGDIPAGSGTTAYEVIGCTNLANNTRTNYIKQTTVPGLGTVNGVTTKVWTEKVGTKVSSWASQKIARVTLVETPLGTLTIDGLSALTHTWHNNGRYRASAVVKVAEIVFTPAAGPAVNVPIPTPGNPVEVPGVARLVVGGVSKIATPSQASALASVLRVNVYPTNTSTILGQARSTIDGRVKSGMFQGYAVGVEGSALSNITKVGRTPYRPLPCVGTNGKDVVTRTAALNLDPLGTIGALAATVNGKSGSFKAVGMAKGRATNIVLLDGALKIEAVTGKVTVTRKNGKLIRNAAGTRVGAIVANGQTYTMPDSGPLEIPGVAKLQSKLTTKLQRGMKVIGLRITLLDGQAATIDIGVASVKIRPLKK